MSKLHYLSRCHRFVSLFLIISVVCFLLGTGCSIKKPYVGEKYNTKYWPKYASGKKLTCNEEVAVFIFTITKTDVDKEYYVEGTMDGSKGVVKSIDHLVPAKCRYYLVFAKNGVIINSCSFRPLGVDHTHKLPFRKRFVSEPFDSVAVTYKIHVRG